MRFALPRAGRAAQGRIFSCLTGIFASLSMAEAMNYHSPGGAPIEIEKMAQTLAVAIAMTNIRRQY